MLLSQENLDGGGRCLVATHTRTCGCLASKCFKSGRHWPYSSKPHAMERQMLVVWSLTALRLVRANTFAFFTQHFFQHGIYGTGSCEGGVDVVGVVTPLGGVAQVVFHGVKVVEVSVLLGVHEEGELEEDGEDQVEAEKKDDEVRERRTWMTVRNSRTP